MAQNNREAWTGVHDEYKVTIGAYHMIDDDSYEPQRTNNFEVHIYGLEGLETVDENHKIDQNIAEQSLTLSVESAGQINTNVGIIEIPYGNTKVKFAGLPSISDSDLVFNDYVGKSTERIIAAWHAKVFNPKTQVIGKASEYKKRALLIETAPDGTNCRVWELKGCWPSNVQYGAYDYNGGGSVRKITMTLSYDIAIPRD